MEEVKTESNSSADTDTQVEEEENEDEIVEYEYVGAWRTAVSWNKDPMSLILWVLCAHFILLLGFKGYSALDVLARGSLVWMMGAYVYVRACKMLGLEGTKATPYRPRTLTSLAYFELRSNIEESTKKLVELASWRKPLQTGLFLIACTVMGMAISYFTVITVFYVCFMGMVVYVNLNQKKD